MDITRIQDELRQVYDAALSKDLTAQRHAIEKAYDVDCRLQNPYMILQGREEILKSFSAVASNNTEISATIETVTYDADLQRCMVQIRQILKPKALGGVMAIRLHYILQLQIEPTTNDPTKYKIVNHQEVHVTQDLLSQMPIIGKWYDSTLRNAVGQLTLAGTSVLQYTGVLDLVPAAVQKTKETASVVRQKTGALAESASNASGKALEATGVSSLFQYAASMIRWGASALAEEGRGVPVYCYSPTCRPGQLCYSPTCPRGHAYSLLSKETLQDVMKGMYSTGVKETQRRIPFLITEKKS